MSINIKTTFPASGETTDDLRASGNPFTWEELLSLFSRSIGGREFDLDEVNKCVESEIQHGILKVEQGKDGLIYRFEKSHPVNKYSELREGISLRERIVSGEVKAKGHGQ
jgi:hypothetical protein